jgi:tetratricopeptide (TPR) repeat protein
MHPRPATRAAAWPSPRTARWLALAIVALAFGLRVAYVLQSRASPYFDAPDMDPLFHLEWARAWASGEAFTEEAYFRAPLYPWFLGLCLRLFGESLLVPRLIQAALGASTVWTCWWIGRRGFGERVGLLGALFAAVYWVSIYFEGELLVESLSVPLSFAALAVSLDLWERPAWKRAALAGMLFGLSAIARPNVLALMPFLAAWLWVAARRAGRPWLAPVAALALGTLAPILPVTLRNAIVGGEPVLIATQAGVNLWIGNNPTSDGSTAIVPGTRAGWWEGYHDAIALAEREAGRELSAGEVSRHYGRKGWGFLVDDPARALAHLAWKLRLFALGWELPNNTPDRFMAFRFGPILRLLPLGFVFVFPLGVLGLLACLRTRASATFPLWGYALVYSASVVVFFVNGRFRMPVMPALCVLAAFGLAWLVSLARARRWLALGACALLLAALVAAAEARPATLDATDAAGWQMLGVAAGRRGDATEARACFERAVAERPENVAGRVHLARVLNAQGEKERAQREARAALELDGSHAEAMDVLADLLIQSQRFEDALLVARRSQAVAPAAASGFYQEARALWMMDRQPEAEVVFRRALALGPDAFNCALGLGSLLASQERWRDAAAAFQQALEMRGEPDAEGWYWKAAQGALVALQRDGRASEAESLKRRLLSRHPDAPLPR